ncbi:MAG: S24 family peptidase [Proteobacteria bacterium]|nr:S24 family peptidase [Pseudomonadota bacterium]
MARNPPDRLLRMSGDAMVGFGYPDGDILGVDRSIQPRHGKIVVAIVNEKMSVTRLNSQH